MGTDKNESKALEWYTKLAGKHNKLFIGNDELIGIQYIQYLLTYILMFFKN